MYDHLITDEELVKTTRKLFNDGHYARAVEEAFKLLEVTVRERSGRSELSGRDLMFQAFDVKTPRLKLNALKSKFEAGQQEGYRFIFGGAMSAIRNPRAHDHQLVDEAGEALEMLLLASHLLRRARRAIRARRGRSTKT